MKKTHKPKAAEPAKAAAPKPKEPKAPPAIPEPETPAVAETLPEPEPEPVSAPLTVRAIATGYLGGVLLHEGDEFTIANAAAFEPKWMEYR